MTVLDKDNLPIPISGEMGKGKQPKEWPDTAVATQSVKVLIAINDGEMYQVENIYLNEFPISNYSHLGVGWEWREGLPNQSAIGDFVDTEAPIPTFKATNLQYATPIYIVVPYEANAVRLTFTLKTLRRVYGNGDIGFYFTMINIKTKQNYNAVEVNYGRAMYPGKVSSPFSWDHIVTRPAGSYEAQTDWIIVLTRETWDDSQMGVKYESDTSVTAATQLFYKNLTYPGTAIVYIAFTNAKIFGGAVPDIKFKLKGRVMYLPNNYDGLNKTYSGEWNGGFKTNMEYSSNPVWIILDVLTRVLTVPIDYADIDLGNFYLCAKYCDERVSNGLGGTEPRFTFNHCFNEKLKIEDFFSFILTIINATFTTNKYGQLALSMDMKNQPIYTIITNSNVIEGEFNYTSNEIDQRYSQVNVTWDDPRYKGGSTISVVQSNADHLVNGINLRERYGLRIYAISLRGCNTYGQAIRKGRHELWVNSIETEFVSFKVLLEGMMFYIGMLFKLCDTTNYDEVMEGRITSTTLIDGGVRITLDKAYTTFTTAQPTASYINFYTEPGVYVNNYLIDKLVDVDGEFTQVEILWNETYQDIVPLVGGLYSIELSLSIAKVFRVVGISESDKIYTINARIHNSAKYDYIDSVGEITLPTYEADAAHRVPPVIYNLQVTQTFTGYAYKLQVTWGWEPEPGITSYAYYRLTWKKDYGNPTTIDHIESNGYDIENVYPGVYEIMVEAIDTVSGMPSPAIGMAYFFKVSSGNSTLFAPINIGWS